MKDQRIRKNAICLYTLYRHSFIRDIAKGRERAFIDHYEDKTCCLQLSHGMKQESFQQGRFSTEKSFASVSCCPTAGGTKGGRFVCMKWKLHVLRDLLVTKYVKRKKTQRRKKMTQRKSVNLVL